MPKSTTNIIKRLKLVFTICGILLLISAIASFYSIKQLVFNSKQVNHTFSVLLKAEEILANLKDAEAGHRGYLLTHNQSFLEPFNSAIIKCYQNLNTLKRITADNRSQQENIKDLRALVERRIQQFRIVLSKEAQGIQNSSDRQGNLLVGKQIMDELRASIDMIEEEERRLLEDRTEAQSWYISYTPVLIFLAALVSMIITTLAYLRIRKELTTRLLHQSRDEARYLETTARISRMEETTKIIASGDYSVRNQDEKTDELGKISKALNDMAASLEKNFTDLENKNWMQSGVVTLSNAMRGKERLSELAAAICSAIAHHLKAPVVACYIMSRDERYLEYKGGYSVANPLQRIPVEDGIVGQSIRENKVLELSDLPVDYIRIGSALGNTLPRHILVVPIEVGDRVLGMLELGSMDKPSERDLQFLEKNRSSIGIHLTSVINMVRLHELVEQIQGQSEELQSQHEELESINVELEAQTQKLLASEEELKVQQEELMQTNSELEERSRLLEERNQMIVEQNLQIQKTAEELALSTKYKSEFLANMSHELRTPLNSILLLSRLLAENVENNLTSEQREYARVIQSSGNGLLALIDEILDLSKIEAGKMELEFEKLSVKEILHDLNALFQPVAKERNLDFSINILPGLPEVIETDKMRLEQILKNLISNALKFTSRGSVEVNIFRPKVEEDTIAFSVKDTGIGIPQEKQQLIFEAFQQADGTTKRKYGGTGLGLSISRELVRLLEGEISVKSEVEKGTEFIVKLPLKKPVSKTHESTESVPAILKSEQGVPGPVTTTDKQRYTSVNIPQAPPDDRHELTEGDKIILIVEDDAAFAKALLNYTRQKGYKGVVSVRGDEAVDLARQYQPAGILLDLQLPVMDGWEVMEELKANSQTRHIPVHIMSSYEAKKESLNKGAFDFINKPVSLEQMQDIFTKLEHILNRENKKVLIVEENSKHAKALAYFLETFNVNSTIAANVQESISVLKEDGAECVILDLGAPDQMTNETLENIRKDPALADLPIIIFTGKNLSKTEEQKIKKYADSIVVKTAHSYNRILDEVSLFLHLMNQNNEEKAVRKYPRLGMLAEVLSNKTILIADDDVRNIFSLTKALENHKVNVVTATDGKEALRQLKENENVDLVLMDIMMPEMDGFEAIRQIRMQHKYRNLPIIAVTAKAMTGDREKCINAGASDYISKPVDMDQLLSLLRVWLYEKGTN